MLDGEVGHQAGNGRLEIGDHVGQEAENRIDVSRAEPQRGVVDVLQRVAELSELHGEEERIAEAQVGHHIEH